MTVPHNTLDDLMAKILEEGVDYDMVLEASVQAREAHADQKRDDGTPYLEQHIYPVALDVMDFYIGNEGSITPQVVAAALLHDAMEEGMSDHGIISRFGPLTSVYLFALTKPDYRECEGSTIEEQKAARDEQYHQQILSAAPEVQVIKLFDRLNNVSCLHTNPDKKKVARYITETEEFYLPLAEQVSDELYDRLLDEVELVKLWE